MWASHDSVNVLSATELGEDGTFYVVCILSQFSETKKVNVSIIRLIISTFSQMGQETWSLLIWEGLLAGP